MRYLLQHINDIIATYNGDLPLAHFLKNHFRQHPKLGSRDRKMLSAMAYNWYRYAKGLGKEKYDDLVTQWMTDRDSLFHYSPGHHFDINKLFPYDIAISAGIPRNEWLVSMLTQPALFIRIRKDKGKLLSLLNAAGLPYTLLPHDCVSLPNGAKIDTILPEDAYVVQDASSQQTGTFFTPHKNELWYDCCCGAGGKSLLLKDKEPGVRLTVSDMRERIMHNLQQRFRMYRHEAPVAHVTNVADTALLQKALGSKRFTSIICDVPCSGSGTWARTPEQLYFFDPADLEKFPPLQHAIAVNAARYLQPGGTMYYITCSVFRQENEEVVDSIIASTGLLLKHAQIINGVSIHADSMFIAVLERKP